MSQHVPDTAAANATLDTAREPSRRDHLPCQVRNLDEIEISIGRRRKGTPSPECPFLAQKKRMSDATIESSQGCKRHPTPTR
jgi:hypothetical protein